MGQITLVDQERSEAEELVNWLEANQFPVHNLFWAEPADSDRVYCYISSPYVDQHGPLASYREIRRGLEAIKASKLTMDGIRAVRIDEPIAVDVRAKLSGGLFTRQPPSLFARDLQYGSVELGGVLMNAALLPQTAHNAHAAPTVP